MAIELQERYGRLVDAKLRATLVQKSGVIWNTRYEGSPKAGAVKVPVRDTEATVVAYDKTAGAAQSYAAGSFLTVTIDKDYAVNEIIDNYDAESVPDNIVADRLDSAGYSLALYMERAALAELLASGTDLGDTSAITADNVYEYVLEARKALSVAGVPAQGRFIIVSPDVYTYMLKSSEFLRSTQLGDAVVQTGAVGQIAGMSVFESAALASESAAVEFIAGHPDWCCRIEEWAVEPHLQNLDGSGTFIGASAIQGRKIFAHKVTKGAAVVCKTNA